MAKKIVIAEDNEHIRMVVEARLKGNGYEVVTAEDGQMALEKIRTESPDLIILDVVMPPPNGFQVCRTIKDDAGLKHIPIILLTSKSSESDKFWGMESGADAYVTKPYNPEDLLAHIKDLLGEL